MYPKLSQGMAKGLRSPVLLIMDFILGVSLQAWLSIPLKWIAPPIGIMAAIIFLGTYYWDIRGALDSKWKVRHRAKLRREEEAKARHQERQKRMEKHAASALDHPVMNRYGRGVNYDESGVVVIEVDKPGRARVVRRTVSRALRAINSACPNCFIFDVLRTVLRKLQSDDGKETRVACAKCGYGLPNNGDPLPQRCPNCSEEWWR